MKCGLEIHQQLKTKKLFCNCPSVLSDKATKKIVRKLRPVPSETGEFDPAALAEFMKGKTYIYEFDDSYACLVELDEEPPREVNREALEVALMVCKYLNCKIVDEIQVMRKTVVDGSNVSGFQRTMLVGMDGYIEIDGKKIRINTVCLEEDAARPIKQTDKEIIYRLDRLGIPLIEITTAPDIESPEEAKKVAWYIGMVLRSTRKVMRGLGTIRQDLNVSVEGGNRVEIKGVQDLDLLDKYVEYEIMRQKKLLEIKDKIKNLEIEFNPVDLTEHFKESECKILKGKYVFGLKCPKMKGILGIEVQPGRRFGSELSDYAKVYGQVGGIIHSDENLSKYKIDEKKIRDILDCSEDDAFILVGSEDKNKAYKAIEAVYMRLIMAKEGVPEETRSPLGDGTTRFSRPMPGAARIYPETDVPPICTRNINVKLNPLLIDLEKEISKEIGEDMAKRIVYSEYIDIYEKANNKKVAADILINRFKGFKREGIDVDSLSDEVILRLIEDYGAKYPKEALKNIVIELVNGKNYDEIIKKYSITIDESEIKSKIEEILNNNKYILEKGDKAFPILMGLVMKEFRGKVDGSVVSKLVRKVLEKYLK